MRPQYLILAGIAALAMLLFASSAEATTIKTQEDISGHVFSCPGLTMTAVPGSIIYITEHHGTSASGNTNDTLTAHPRHDELIGSDGNTYYEVGALWDGDTLNAQTGSGESTFTLKVQFVTAGGGIVGTTNLLIHTSPNGDVNQFQFGPCSL